MMKDTWTKWFYDWEWTASDSAAVWIILAGIAGCLTLVITYELY